MEGKKQERIPRRKLEDNSYLSEMDKHTLSENFENLEEILERHPTIFLRPGDRTDSKESLYIRDHDGQSYLGIIMQHGSHATQTPAEHMEPRIKMHIVSREAKPINKITDEEFKEMYRVIPDQEAAVEWLKEKYSNSEEPFTTDSIVTVYKIEYI